MEQLDFFSITPTEEWVFETLRPYLADILRRNNVGENNIKCNEGTTYSSVVYLKYDPYDSSKKPVEQLGFRLCCRKNRHHFEISAAIIDAITVPSNKELRIMADGFYRLDFNPTTSGILDHADFLCTVLEKAVDSIFKDFDCCSRYVECSNAKRCVNPSSSLAVSCGYRKILKSGRIFYGPNRNIGR